MPSAIQFTVTQYHQRHLPAAVRPALHPPSSSPGLFFVPLRNSYNVEHLVLRKDLLLLVSVLGEGEQVPLNGAVQVLCNQLKFTGSARVLCVGFHYVLRKDATDAEPYNALGGHSALCCLSQDIPNDTPGPCQHAADRPVLIRGMCHVHGGASFIYDTGVVTFLPTIPAKPPRLLTCYGCSIASMTAPGHANTALIISFPSEMCAANAGCRI